MISVVFVDNCRLWTSALEKCVAADADIQLLSVVPSIPLAVEAVARHAPSVLAFRLDATDARHRSLGRNLIRDTPGAHGLAYSLTDYDPLDEAWAAASGFKGYVGSFDGLEVLIGAIKAVGAGGSYFLKSAGDLEVDVSDRDEHVYARALRTLSAREIEVFRLTGDGMCCKEIASTIGINAKTVETYRMRIREKMGLRGSGDLLRVAIRSGRARTADRI